MILDTRVHRRPEIESDHYLVIAPIHIPPRWIQKKPQVLNKELNFRVELLQDPSIKWLFERRVNKMIEEIKEANNIRGRMGNTKITQASSKRKFRNEKEMVPKKRIKKVG
jgi:hypothetical protein